MPVIMVLVVLCLQAALWEQADWAVQSAATQSERIASGMGGSMPAGASAAERMLGSDRAVRNPVVSVRMIPGAQVEVVITASATSVLPGIRMHVRADRVGPAQVFRVHQ